MKSSSSPHRPTAGSLEILESRIAPARLIIVGVPDNAPGSNVSPNYDTTGDNLFVDTVTGHNGILGLNDPTVMAVGGHSSVLPQDAAHPDTTFFLRLSKGDALQVVSGSSRTELVKVNAGKVIAFFEDRNHDNEIQSSELISLATSSGAKVVVQGGLPGSVVANVNADFNVELNDLVSTKQTIGSLQVSGAISGKILAGGDINNVSVGSVPGVFAGTAALQQSYTFFAGLEGQGTVKTGTITSLSTTANTLTPAVGQVGASINTFASKTVAELRAGNGGTGAAGGALNSVRILENTVGFQLSAGNGGVGDLAAGKASGGAGGSITGVYVTGFSDSTPHDFLSIHAGTGGAAPDGTGGHGGNITSAYIGAALNGGKLDPSGVFVSDDVSIAAGNGGAGKIGGAGGSLKTIRSTTTTAVDTAQHLATFGLTHEIEITAGNGGNSTSLASSATLHGGAGGSISNTIVINQSTQSIPVVAANEETILLQAGDAGTLAGVSGVGANGGSIVGATLVGSNLIINAGDGSNGTTGGNGGALTTVTVDQRGATFTHRVVANAGNGGNATTGKGGAGGATTTFSVVNSDLSLFSLNTVGALGGNSTGGKGGAGGLVQGLQVLDSDNQAGNVNIVPQIGAFTLLTGAGGDGVTGGGKGGNLINSKFEAVNMSAVATAGSGGDATTSGTAGAGGSIDRFRVLLDGNLADTVVGPNSFTTASFAVVTSGTGGNGAVNGGAGGKITTALVRVFDDAGFAVGLPPSLGGNATLIAGGGGTAQTGAAGSGGGVVTSGVYSQVGSGLLQAGDAGAGGIKAAKGGSIVGLSTSALTGLYAANNLTISAGDGATGGAGGSLRFIGYGAATQQLVPVPAGDILISAGQGSAFHHTTTGKDAAGAGGSIANLYGSVAGSLGSVTSIVAGDGGFVANGTKAGAGGSIDTVVIQRGPDFGTPGGFLSFDAGNAGGSDQNVGSTAVVKGATGGSITNIRVRASVGDTVVRHLAAGDGGAGTTTGGAGGSISVVRVEQHDIGLRTGAAYGYNADSRVEVMGGLFAGAGGKSQVDAKAGNVSDVSADSISTIVAGKEAVPQLANTVAKIKLNGNVPLNPVLGTTNADLFQLSYHPVLVETAHTEGAAGSPESQTFQRIPGGSDADLRGEVMPAGGPSTFTLSFAGQTTRVLDADAAVDEIEAALNELPAVMAAGGATVTEGNADDSAFTVEFTEDGDRTPLTGLGTEKTAPLLGNAKASAVQAALNQLSQVTDEGVGTFYPGLPPATVTTAGLTNSSSGDASYRVVYQPFGATFGDLTAERILDDKVTEIVVGTPTQASVQRVEFLGTGQFQLSYVVDPAFPDVEVTTTPLNTDATPQEVQAALNTALQGVADVTVAAGEVPHSFVITFNTPGDVELLHATEFASLLTTKVAPGSASSQEVQTFNFTPLHGVNDLAFLIPGSATPIIVPAHQDTSTPPTVAEVQQALNASNDFGDVTVTLTANNTFHIVAVNAGDDTLVKGIQAYEVLPTSLTTLQSASTNDSTATESRSGNGAMPEIQHITLNPAAENFTLRLGDSNQVSDVLNGSSSPTGSATAAQVQDAINELILDPSYSGTADNGPVSVTKTGANEYDVVFGNNNDQGGLRITQAFDQVQRLAVSDLGTFQFAGSPAVLTANASAAQVEAALDALGTDVQVTMVPGEHGVFNIEYTDGQAHSLPAVLDKLNLASTTTGRINNLAYTRQIAFDPDAYASANLVGAIADFNHLGADKFAYIDVNGDGVFNIATGSSTGDLPIDGLIAAKNFSQKTSNFTPQARLIINSDATSAPGKYLPVDPANPGKPVFYDFANDQLV